MAQALEIRRAESPATTGGLALSDIWLLPVLLLGRMFALFRHHLAKLKAMRRRRRAPNNWRDFYPDLREAEWPIQVLLAEGARQILSGQTLDLNSITFDPEPPDSFEPPMPRSALAMHQRIEDTARFNADPEAYVRRRVARIRAAAATNPSAPAAAPSHRMVLMVVSSSFFLFSDSAGQRIRAPPPAAACSHNTSPAPCPFTGEAAGVCAPKKKKARSCERAFAVSRETYSPSWSIAVSRPSASPARIPGSA